MTEKQIIEQLSQTHYGPYELARRIVTREFNSQYNANIASRVNRTFYSILSVIRRYRAKQNQPVTA